MNNLRTIVEFKINTFRKTQFLFYLHLNEVWPPNFRTLDFLMCLTIFLLSMYTWRGILSDGLIIPRIRWIPNGGFPSVCLVLLHTRLICFKWHLVVMTMDIVLEEGKVALDLLDMLWRFLSSSFITEALFI